jgi:hypothetical protein
MSRISEEVSKRLDQVIETCPVKITSNEGTHNGPLQAACIGWMSTAINMIELLVPDPNSGYRVLAAAEREAALRSIYNVNKIVGHLLEVLKALKIDAQQGLLTKIEACVSGETFDDILDHAAQYLSEGRHAPSGVLAGVTFEDTIRRLCDKHNIVHRGRELDTLLSALKSANVLTKLEQKEGIVGADVRAKATHADWSAFNAEQVETVIKLTRRLVREKLAQ